MTYRFIAADYYYQKDASKIAAQKALFPSRDEVFLIDYQKGERRALDAGLVKARQYEPVTDRP